MARYLTVNQFKELMIIPNIIVQDVEAENPGWVDKQLERWGRWIDSRLRKRYTTPFAANDDAVPTPMVIQGWLSSIVSVKCLLKRGIDSDDRYFQLVKDEFDSAVLEIQEASDGELGMFDLPIDSTKDGTAVSRRKTMSLTEHSPYVASSQRRRLGRLEDESGRGTGG